MVVEVAVAVCQFLVATAVLALSLLRLERSPEVAGDALPVPT
jgi:hypothetical protein